MDAIHMLWKDGNRAGERIVELQGPLTLNNVNEFQDAVRHQVPPVLIIDLTQVPYMDSAALGALLSIHVSCCRHGRRYALFGAPERVRKLFKIANVTGVLTLCDSLADAQALLREPVAPL